MAKLEDQFRVAEFMSKPTTEGGMSYGDYPNPYGLRAFETDQGYGGEMMPKTTGWAGEIPTLTGDNKMTEVSLGGENDQPFIPMIFEGITPEQIEIVRDYEAGLREDNDPKVIEVKKAAELAAFKRMHMHKSPFKDLTPHLAGGGALAKALGKKLAEAATKNVAKKTAYELAHEKAQKNAVEMLRLHPENTAMDRARAMGFDVDNPVYHGTGADIKEFDVKGQGDTAGAGAFFTTNPIIAETYSPGSGGGNILPVYIKKTSEMLKANAKGKNWDDLDTNEILGYNSPEFWDSGLGHNDRTTTNYLGVIADDLGYPGVVIKNVKDLGPNSHAFRAIEYLKNHHNLIPDKTWDNIPYDLRTKAFDYANDLYDLQRGSIISVNKPSHIRSKHAAFDPAEADSPDLLKAKGGSAQKGKETIEEWKPEPISSKFADTLAKTRSALDEAFPVDIGSFLLQQSPELIKEMSYGKSPVSGTKNIQTTTFDPRLVDLQMAAAPFAGSAKKLLKDAGMHALEKIEAGTLPGVLEPRMYAAEPGKRAAKYTKKEAIQGDLRHMPYEDALALAQKGVHLKQDPSGQFVGAPRGVTSLKDIKKLRENFDKMVSEGAKGGDWYERAQQFHKEYTPNPEAATELSRANALFSAQADPISNLGFTLQAHNALEAGAPQKIVRTGPQASRYYKALEEGKPIPLGPKTDIYAKYIDPNLGIGSTGVNDFRHARNLGYTQKDLKTGEVVPISRGLSPQEHAFMDAETILATDRANKKALAGKTDWKPEEVQAAPWVLQKAESLMKGSPGRFPTLDKAMEEANKTYLEGAPKHTAISTYEQIPYASSGHLEGMEKVPYNLKEQFSKESNWFDNFGKDILSQKVGARRGMLTGKTETGQGMYINPTTGIPEFNPQFSSRSLVGLKPGEFGPELQDQSKALMDAQAVLRSYFDVQGASPWIKPLQSKATPATSLHLQLTDPLTQEEFVKLNNTAQKHGYGVVIDTGSNGAIITYNPELSTGQELGKKLKAGFEKDLHETLPGKISDISRVRTEGSYPNINLEDVLGVEHKGSGKATTKMFEQLQKIQESNPDVVSRLMESDPELASLLSKMNERDITAQSKYNVGAPREDILNARDIVSKSGLSGLKKALGEGAYLPAVASVPFVGKENNEE